MISIIIPLYNKRDSIARALISVLNQTYTNYEIIVINDGSTDGSAHIAEQILVDSSLPTESFCVYSQANSGVSAARNQGVKLAEGEWVAFLDADDEWVTDYLEAQNSLIEDYPESTITGLAHKKAWINSKNHNTIVSPDFQYRGLLPSNWSLGCPFWTGCVMVKREALINLKDGMFDEKLSYGEDLDVWMRLMYYGVAAFDSKVGAIYYQDAENKLTSGHMPLREHIPSLVDKYATMRSENSYFRRYFDTQMIYRLYPYLFNKTEASLAKQLGEKLDYSQLKYSLFFRMNHPSIYKFFTTIRDIWN